MIKKEFLRHSSAEYNLCFAVIFEREELDHRGSQVVWYLQLCTDNITTSFYLLKIQILNPGTISL